MAFPRRSFGQISLEVPPGLFEDDEAPAGFLAALTAIAPATLRIRRLDPAGAPSLADVLSGLSSTAPQTVTAIGRKHTWQGLSAADPGDPQCVHFLFESGGEIFHGLAEAPAGLWADYGPYLEGAMLSLDTGQKPRPSFPLHARQAAPAVADKPSVPDPVETVRSKLADAEQDTVALILSGRFEDAEARLLAIDADVYGAHALARAYESALAMSPGEAEIYTRALHWARSGFPDPHTAIEAEQFHAAIAEREARLTQIHQPD